MRKNEQLEKKWAEVLDYATQHAKGEGLRKGLPWLRSAFNEFFKWHEEEVEAGRAMSFGGQSGNTRNREVMADLILLELGPHIGSKFILAQEQENSLKKSLDFIVHDIA